MENFIFTVNSVIPLFLLVAVGYWARAFKIIPGNFPEILNAFVFKLAIPLSLFRTAYNTDLVSNFDLKLVGTGVMAVFAIVGALWLIVPRFTTRPKAGSIIQACYRTNIVLFGLALCTNLFGEENIAPMAVLIAVIVPLFNIIAVIVLTIMGDNSSEVPSVKELTISICRNPLIYMTVLGIIFSVVGIKLPHVIYAPVNDLASCANPVAMISLGAQFSFGSALKNVKINTIVVITRLFLIPALVLPVFIALGFRGPELGALFVGFSSPTATSSFVMAKNLGCDADIAGEGVIFTTFFSAVSIFMWVFVLKSFALI